MNEIFNQATIKSTNFLYDAHGGMMLWYQVQTERYKEKCLNIFLYIYNIYRRLQVRRDSYKLIANGRDSTRKIIYAWGTKNDIEVWSIHGGVTVVYSLSTCAWAL